MFQNAALLLFSLSFSLLELVVYSKETRIEEEREREKMNDKRPKTATGTHRALPRRKENPERESSLSLRRRRREAACCQRAAT